MAILPKQLEALAERAGVRLETSEIGFYQPQALEALLLLDGTDICVLGGDVYRKGNGRWVPAYDNWYCQRESTEPELVYAARSRKRAVDYISKYPAVSESHLFVMVLCCSDRLPLPMPVLVRSCRKKTVACMIGWGLILNEIVFVAFLLAGSTFPAFFQIITAPSTGLAWVWSETFKLPPRGEAGFYVPLVISVVQWFVIGCFIGLWRSRRKSKMDFPSES